MRRNRYPLICSLITAALLVVPAATAVGQAPGPKAPIASERLAGAFLDIVPQVEYETALLRVSGPDGFAVTKHFDASRLITLDLETEAKADLVARDLERSSGAPALPDGQYHYEVIFTDSEGERGLHSGVFFAARGELLTREAKRAELANLRAELVAASEDPSPQGENFDDFVFISDAAEDDFTRISFGNSSTLFEPWSIANLNDTFRIRRSNFLNPFTEVMTALPSGFVGIGTTAPQADLHIASSLPRLRMTSASNDFLLYINTAVNEWRVRNQPTFASILKVRNTGKTNTLVLTGEGVGLGTASPSADLDLHNITGSDRTVAAFNIDGFTWRNTALDNGTFFFNRADTAAPEFRVRRADHAEATLVASGHVMGTSFKSTSSREMKTDFEEVEPVDVLAKLSALPVTSWRYLTENERVRHIGPVAEDFQRLFGLGDGKTISTVDASGVMMAAIQGLLAELEARDSRIAVLEGLSEENADLKDRLSALERLVSSLVEER